MSVKHVNQYFLEIENQYLEMLDDLKELKELYAEQKITNESYQQVAEEVSKLKENYERIAYILFLLKKPNKKDKKEDNIAKSWYAALKQSSKEALLNENNDVLKHIKKLIKEGKLNNNEQI